MWLLAVGCGMVVGKTIIHGMVLSRFLRLKMFRADQVFTYISLHVTIDNHVTFYFLDALSEALPLRYFHLSGLLDGAIFYCCSFSVPFLTCL